MDYQNGKIYQITDIGYTKCYIGSTTQPLSKRFAIHKSYFKTYLGKYTSHKLFDEFGVHNCKIELIEEFPCENREQLCKREGEIIKNTECVNKNIAGRTHKEYDKQHYIANKDEINQWKKEQNICICGGKYTNVNKAQHNKTTFHQTYINQQTKKISQEDYNLLFELDSLMLIPATYNNIIISS